MSGMIRWQALGEDDGTKDSRAQIERLTAH